MDRDSESPSCVSDDLESLYKSHCSSAPSGKTAIFQSTHRLEKSDSLFYTDVCAAGGVQLKAMIDSGSISCSVSEAAAARLLQHFE